MAKLLDDALAEVVRLSAQLREVTAERDRLAEQIRRVGGVRLVRTADGVWVARADDLKAALRGDDQDTADAATTRFADRPTHAGDLVGDATDEEYAIMRQAGHDPACAAWREGCRCKPRPAKAGAS